MDVYWVAQCPHCRNCQPIIRELNHEKEKLSPATYNFTCSVCGEKVSCDSDKMERYVVHAEAA